MISETTLQPQANLMIRIVKYIWLRKQTLGLLFLSVLLPLVIFGKLGREVFEQERFSFDESILFFIYSFRSSLLDVVALLFSKLGYEWGVFPFDVGLFIYFVYKRQKNKALFWALAVGGAALINQMAKLFFERPRPELWLPLAPESNFSFPSGHAMGATAMALSLIILAWHTKWRNGVTVTVLLFAVMVCLSRLYLGVHYPSDVLAGILASTAWVMGLRLVLVKLKLYDSPVA